MNRIGFSVFALLGALTPLVFDSALKGAALLAVAALCALALWRASAATRHLVWLVAVVALLVVPVLSVALPQWRILPKWARVLEKTEMTTGPGFHATDGTGATDRSRALHGSHPAPLPTRTDLEPLPSGPFHLALNSADTISESPRPWHHWIAPAWATGFTLLILRLLFAQLLLRRVARGCTVATAAFSVPLHATCTQLGLRQRITLLLDEKRTIPVVWGVFRPRLLLPAEARAWSDEQLRSVLLHELAHIRRRDALVQWLTQIACALHWWNPLVWLAAWRLHVERERACDDLVLATGVRPSTYAGHLLHVATKLSPGRWTSACGLAMARRSSLEGRLVAVLSERLNRRGVSAALAALALALGAGIAIPIAMLRAAESEKPTTDGITTNAEPKDAASKALFESWKTSARTDGKIPGGCIGEMAASLKTYMDLNAGTEAASRCEAVIKKCDATHDWAPAEAAALLDEIEAAAPSRAEWAMRTNIERTIHPGKPLPDELKDVPWGQPAANGLCIAWLLEPRAETHPLDSVLKSRVLFHNTGKTPVCFATEDWIQTGGHKAKDANGKDITVWAVDRMGIRTRMVFRLAPGEYAEVVGHGIGVGSHETSSEKSIYKVGCWIEAKDGDGVTFMPGKLLVSFQTWQNNEGRKDSETVWNEMIAARVAQKGPLPATVADRELLLKRVTQDLGIAAPYYSSRTDFVHDNSPDALATLTAKLQEAGKSMHFAGELSGGETNFRVTAADPAAAKNAAKLDRAMLEGTWEGEKDGAKVEVKFEWLSEHQQVRWKVKQARLRHQRADVGRDRAGWPRGEIRFPQKSGI